MKSVMRLRSLSIFYKNNRVLHYTDSLQNLTYLSTYIIKLASMVYIYPENRDPTYFGIGPPEGLIRPWSHSHSL